MRITFALLLIAAATGASAGNVRLCPGPDERYRSPFYQVEVDGAGPAFVYHHENGWKKVPDKKGGNWEYRSMSADNNWAAMSARGIVGLKIRPTGIAATTVELLPERGPCDARLHTRGARTNDGRLGLRPSSRAQPEVHGELLR